MSKQIIFILFSILTVVENYPMLRIGSAIAERRRRELEQRVQIGRLRAHEYQERLTIQAARHERPAIVYVQPHSAPAA